MSTFFKFQFVISNCGKTRICTTTSILLGPQAGRKFAVKNLIGQYEWSPIKSNAQWKNQRKWCPNEFLSGHPSKECIAEEKFFLPISQKRAACKHFVMLTLIVSCSLDPATNFESTNGNITSFTTLVCVFFSKNKTFFNLFQ